MQLFNNFIYPRSIDLLNITWIGLITHVVVTRISEFRIIKDIRERVLYIGETEHTILFKYEIYKLDQQGVVIKSVSFYINTLH